jgi:hypothetical protein
MNVRPFVLVAFVVGLLVVSSPIFAHHGLAAYDTTKVMTVKGTVTDFQFINPHVEIYLDVEGADGKVQKWVAEGVSVGNMARGGWTKNTLKAGDRITVVGNAAKNGSHAMTFSKVVTADGKTLAIERANDYAN